MQVANKHVISLNTITDLGVVAYLGVSRYMMSMVQQDFPSPSHELNSWATAAVSVLAFVWIASRMWEQIRSRNVANTKEGADNAREIREIKELIQKLREDLLQRRSVVDKDISRHTWQIEAIEKIMSLSDSRERKNLRKLEHLETRMTPWLKEFEPEGTRGIASAFQRIDDEEATNNGDH